MPRIISYQPSWLSRPSPGFDFFYSSRKSKGKPSTQGTDSGNTLTAPSEPRRTIARRGTEIFTLVDNEIRWSDLILLRDNGLAQLERSQHGRRRETRRGRQPAPDDEEGDIPDSYRVLKVPVSGQVTQLIISPHGDYMAIATSHTVHIAVLPDSSHLGTQDTSPLKLKTFHLGPTAHVLEQSPIASIIWHPLGVQGRCLVTVTRDAVVRLWEVNSQDRFSFSEPALAFDVKKLANATSAEEDFRASRHGASKGFSPDSFELEVASACFGGLGTQTNEYGWAPMTLWLAMKEGDLYALCPLLPSRWQVNRVQPNSPYIRSLSVSIGAKSAAAKEPIASGAATRNASQQSQWLSDIESQTPMIVGESFQEVEIFSRPAEPGAIPKLQGPFQLEPELEQDEEITDILVTGLAVSDPEDAETMGEDEGIPTIAISLLTDRHRIHNCLSLDEVAGQWLPSGETKSVYPQDDNPPSLLVMETVALRHEPEETPFPANFTADVASRHSFFVNHDSCIYSVSIAPWIRRLQEELGNPQGEGAGFRVDLFLEGNKSLVECIIRIPQECKGPADPPTEAASCVVLEDSDLGYFLLASAGGQPYAVTFDNLELDALPAQRYLDYAYDSEIKALPLAEPRLPYQPSPIFWQKSALLSFVNDDVPSRHRHLLKEEVRLSPATLELLTRAHRILSQETHQLGLAAADLFRRCERLQDEFRDQIKRANDVATRIESITGDDEENFGDEDKPVGNARLEKRLEDVKTRHQELMDRHDRVRRKLTKATSRGLSDREKEFIREVEDIVVNVHDRGGLDTQHAYADSEAPLAWKRLDEVREWKEKLIRQAEGLTDEEGSIPSPHARIPSEFKKQKIEQVKKLLERQDTLLSATQERQDRLRSLLW